MYLSETMKWKRSTSAKQPAGLSETEEYVYWFEHLLSSGDDDQAGKLKAFKQKIMSMPEEMRDPILVSGPDNPSSPPGPGTPMFLTIPRDPRPLPPLRPSPNRTQTGEGHGLCSVPESQAVGGRQSFGYVYQHRAVSVRAARRLRRRQRSRVLTPAPPLLSPLSRRRPKMEERVWNRPDLQNV